MVDSVAVVVRKEAVSIEPVAGIIPVDGGFYSAVSRDIVPHESYRGFSFHFGPGMEHEEKLRRIGEVLGIEKFEHVVTRQTLLPSPVLGHDKLVEEVDGLLAGKPLLLTGNYFSGLAIEDCVSRSLGEFKRLTG
jgi:hypothetical protein